MLELLDLEARWPLVAREAGMIRDACVQAMKSGTILRTKCR